MFPGCSTLINAWAPDLQKLQDSLPPITMLMLDDDGQSCYQDHMDKAAHVNLLYDARMYGEASIM